MPSSTTGERDIHEQWRNGGPSLDRQALDDDDDDIYRGGRPLTRHSSSSSASSSSSSIQVGGRLGAIAAVVELAISRWARARSSSSASSISTATNSRSHTTRRRHPSSSINLRSIQSERDIAARIKAREESRQSPREFALYLIPTVGPGDRRREGITTRPLNHEQGIAFTTSLPLILERLDHALKKSIRARLNLLRQARIPLSVSLPSRDYVPPNGRNTPPSLSGNDTTLPVSYKGKQKDVTLVKTQARDASDEHVWLLDVSSPTWEDMRAIGKLLHFHPLTLEDILHQDPREKYELFSRLGYYFVVFRAIDSSNTREQAHEATADGDTNAPPNEGVLGASLVYLVVFWDGICIFHYTDVSEHVDRVKNRLFRLDRTFRTSSDWVAHGILDSIVDAFFPYLEDVEKEVLRMEDLVFSEGELTQNDDAKTAGAGLSTDPQPVSLDLEKVDREIPKEKSEHSPEAPRKTFSIFRLFPGLGRIGQSRHFMQSLLESMSLVRGSKSISTAITLRRLAKTRRLVTSLTRLLATKSEIIAQIRKRLLTPNHPGIGFGESAAEDIDVAIYLGDVQDHILSIQHSLSHYERMLGQSYPKYLSQLSINVAQVKSGSDKAVMALTIISIAILCIQVPIGALSLNINVPTNGHFPGDPHNVFFCVLALAVLMAGCYLSLVRWWWVRSKRKRFDILQ